MRKLGPRSGPIDELGLGGGVWRAKHHYNSQLIACACMHYKYQVVEVADFSSLSKHFFLLQLISIKKKYLNMEMKNRCVMESIGKKNRIQS